MHTLLLEETAVILDLVETWGVINGSRHKLAHRGSYENLVWVSPSTVRRVLAENDLILPERPPRTRQPKRDLPDWLVMEPNRIWA